LQHVLRELERLGYDATAGVFSAREVGAPHKRKRVFILGCRADLGTSGRAIVSGLLERWGNVEYTESRYRPRWRVPELERFQVQAREPSTAPETVGDTESRKDRQRGPRALDRAQPDKQRENGLSATASGRDRGAAYPAPRGGGATMGDTPRVQDTRREPRDRNRESAEAWFQILLSRDRGRYGYPAPRGRDQYSWEPPRVTREAQPAMGRDLDGTPDRMDYAELSRAMDNRTDELRMLGNGVVPDTAARAFRVLWGQLTNEQ
jgi:DNA (cytosine-5)-methyltransferase 1